MNAIKITNLTKRYGDITAIDNINLEIKEGDFFGFIGSNGAGKTTTIKTMLGLLKPASGTVELLGKNINENDFQEYIGLVPGEANLYDNLTVKEQLEYFAKYYTTIDESYVRKLKIMFGVKDDMRISELSLGNKKKVSIICSLMNKPKLLFLDEVSNSLDPLMQKMLFEELTRLNAAGTTIFFSSHNLEEVQEYCKNVAIIRKGKIVKVDNIEKITKSLGLEVTIKTKNNLNFDFLKKQHITIKKLSSGSISFIYKEDINDLVKYLAKYQLETLRIADVKLEEIFDEYYESKNK